MSTRTLSAAFLLGSIIVAPLAAQEDAPDIQGSWRDQDGHDVWIVRRGGRYLGAYDWQAGTMILVHRDGAFHGWWTQAPRREAPGQAGEVVLRPDRRGESPFLDGRWRYGEQAEWREDWDFTWVTREIPESGMRRLDEADTFREPPPTAYADRTDETPRVGGQVVTDAFYDSVRRAIAGINASTTPSGRPGLSHRFFHVGDPDAFLSTIRGYLVGAAVDPAYLAGPYPGKTADAQGSPPQGVMFPRDETTPYAGWIVLQQDPPNPTTEFHEAIHAHHLARGSNDDDGKAAEDACNSIGSGGAAASFITNVRLNLDPQIDALVTTIRGDRPYEQDLARVRRTIESRRGPYASAFDAVTLRILRNIGGEADWDGYVSAFEALVAREIEARRGPDPASGIWDGPWSNTRGESGDHAPLSISVGADGTVTGVYDGCPIQDGRRAGPNVFTWVHVRCGSNAGRDYSVRFTVAADGRTGTIAYDCTRDPDREPHTYSGTQALKRQ